MFINLNSLLVIYVSIHTILCQDCFYPGMYSIKPLGNENLALDAHDPHKLHLYASLGDQDQAFRLVCENGDTLSILHPKTGKYLDASFSGDKWPKPASLAAKNDKGYQRWVYIPYEGMLVNDITMYALDVSRANFVSGNIVGVYPASGYFHQQWVLEPLAYVAETTVKKEFKEPKH